jgi:hypothetical protein
MKFKTVKIALTFTMLGLTFLLLAHPATAVHFNPCCDQQQMSELKIAAENGDSDAQLQIANEYLAAGMKGGPSEDFKIALKWMQKSADQNNSTAQLNLGGMYRFGQGVPIDFVQAYKWHILAAGPGHNPPDTLAVSYRSEFKEHLTKEQIAKAERLANEWKPITHK